MAVEFQLCSNTVSWDCCTSANNAWMHGYMCMQMLRVLAVYVQMNMQILGCLTEQAHCRTDLLDSWLAS